MAGEDVEIAALITQYARLIRAAVARVAGARADAIADDVEQKVAIALWGQVRREQVIEHPASYVYRCAVRETVRAVRALPTPGAGEADDLPAEGPGPEDELRARRVSEAIDRSLARMQPDRARAAAAHVAGFDVEEIMALHGWPYQKARNLIARGMADLRQALREAGFDDHYDPDRGLDPADDLRRAWRPTAPGVHPTDDAWAELAAGTMEPGARDQVAAHVVRCRACARTWRAITALGPAAAPATDRLAARRRRGRWVAPIALGVAAAAALLLFWWRRPHAIDEGADVLRGSRAAAIEVAGPRGTIAGDPSFAWTPPAAIAIDGYVVHVLTDDGRPVWTSARVASPPVTLPGEARKPGRYAWYVEALRGERVVASSRNTGFAIAP